MYKWEVWHKLNKMFTPTQYLEKENKGEVLEEINVITMSTLMLMRKFLFSLVVVVSLTGCSATGHVLTYDSSLIPYKTPEHNPSIKKAITFFVGGDKTFSGRPLGFFGSIFVLNLDLEKIQTESAKKVFLDNVTFQSIGSPEFAMRSSITNFGYKVKNVGLMGQQAAVSFKLNIALTKNGTVVFQDSSTAVDYAPSETVFTEWDKIILAPWITAHTGKADKLAYSAFVATAIFICDKYNTTLESLQH